MTYKIITIPKPEVFNNLYGGFLGGGNRAGDKKKQFGSPGAVARIERRIIGKLKEISEEVPKEDREPGQLERRLKPFTDVKHVLRLTADEYKMLVEYLNSVEWLTSGAENVADLFDAVDAASQEEGE